MASSRWTTADRVRLALLLGAWLVGELDRRRRARRWEDARRMMLGAIAESRRQLGGGS